MERISNRADNDQSELPPPPPYTTVVYKVDDPNFDLNLPPPNYSDVNGQSVVYINNYPGPPLTDGFTQAVQDNISTIHENILSKKARIYLLVNGIIILIFGFISVGIQIGILASHSIIYYYYGFWGGAFLLAIGISTIVLFHRPHQANYSKLFRSFFWQMMLVIILFGVGILIVVTDKCNDNQTEDDGQDRSCRFSHKILNGSLLTIFGLAFLQSIVNTVVFGALKRRYPMVSNSLA